MYATDDHSHFFEVKLELFDGPIDLLLHLVKQRELPIENLSLAAVTEQYLSCLERVRQFDLELAGEYLVIAATLLSIKSSVLLNQPVELEEDEEGNLVDPHAMLLEKLRQAQVYKAGAWQLAARHLLGVDVFAAPSQLSEIEAPLPELKAHDPYLLGKAFRKLIEKAKAQGISMTITVDSVSVVSRMMNVLESLRAAGGRLAFDKVITDLTSRAAIISSFVALLELCKRQAISVIQDQVFEEIFIELSGVEFNLAGLESEFDASPESVASAG